MASGTDLASRSENDYNPWLFLLVRAVRHLQPVDALQIDRVILKRDRVVLFESIAKKVFDVGIEFGLHDEFVAVVKRSNFALFDGQFPSFDDVPRVTERELTIGFLVIDRQVGVGPDTEMPFLLHAECPGGTGTRDNGDFA